MTRSRIHPRTARVPGSQGCDSTAPARWHPFGAHRPEQTPRHYWAVCGTTNRLLIALRVLLKLGTHLLIKESLHLLFCEGWLSGF